MVPARERVHARPKQVDLKESESEQQPSARGGAELSNGLRETVLISPGTSFHGHAGFSPTGRGLHPQGDGSILFNPIPDVSISPRVTRDIERESVHRAISLANLPLVHYPQKVT